MFFFFGHRAKHLKLTEAQRAASFAAGFRCGQEAILSRLGSQGAVITEWEKQEALNAVNHGFQQAAEFVPSTLSADKLVAA